MLIDKLFQKVVELSAKLEEDEELPTVQQEMEAA